MTTAVGTAAAPAVADTSINPAQAGLPVTAAVAAPVAAVEAPAPVVAAPVAAPAAAPALTGAEGEALPDGPASSTDGSAITYDATGDTGLDVALSFVGNLGIGMDHPAMLATADGDFSLIKAHLATLGDKARGWEQMVALAEGAFTRSSEAAATKTASINTAVHAAAGGEEGWNAIQLWASNNATPDEKAAINGMLSAGPVQARAAALMLAGLHAQAGGTVIEPASAIRDASARAGTSDTGRLTTQAYVKEVEALRREVGSAQLQSHPKYAALGRRLG